MTLASSNAISRATNADLSDVLALLRRCELLETGVGDAIASFFVARSATTLVGCAGLERYGSFGLLRSVAVAAPTRENGLGTKLVESICNTARAKGLLKLFLLTTTAEHFFERRGFRRVERSTVPPEVAESWEFRAGCPQTAVAMSFELGDHSPEQEMS